MRVKTGKNGKKGLVGCLASQLLQPGLIFLGCLLACTGLPHAQSYRVAADGSKATVKGTSTLHDWHMAGNALEGGAELVLNNAGSASVVSLNVAMKAKSLRSNSKLMDKKAHKALETSGFPEIKFILDTLLAVEQKEKRFRVLGMGGLTVRGVTKKIEVRAKGEIQPDGAINCEANFPLKMTDFNIAPPSAVLGAIKTGDSLEVSVDLKFVRR